MTLRILTISRGDVESLKEAMQSETAYEYEFLYGDHALEISKRGWSEFGRYYLELTEDKRFLGWTNASMLAKHEFEHMYFGLGFSQTEEDKLFGLLRETPELEAMIKAMLPHRVRFSDYYGRGNRHPLAVNTTSRFSFCTETQQFGIVFLEQPLFPEYDFH